jgi:hypothetical protein
VWPDSPFAHGVEVDTSSDAAVLLVGEGLTSKGGYIYTFLDGNSFDGAAIEAIWMTKTLYGQNEAGQPAMSNRKRWRWLDLLFRINQDVDLTVEWLSGAATNNAAALGSLQISPGAEQLYTASGSAILTASGSTIFLSKQSAQAKAILHTPDGDYLHDEGIRIRVGTNSTAGPWALEAMQLAYQVLKGFKRRDQ